MPEGPAQVQNPEQFEDDAPFQEDGEALAELEAFQRTYADDHSWEQLQEDEHGRLQPLVLVQPSSLTQHSCREKVCRGEHEQDARDEQRAKRQRLRGEAANARIRRGLIRYLQVVLDQSKAGLQADMRPTRAALVAQLLQAFVRDFFDQNPLSHLGLLAMRQGTAAALTELSGSAHIHIGQLKAAQECGGDASLQAALELALGPLQAIPPYGHREVLIVLSALTTCDAGDIRDAIKAAKQHRVRVSIIGLSAEVHICRRITEDTGGTYLVALSEAHLRELIAAQAPPPPVSAANAAASLVRMGFPQRGGAGRADATFVGEGCQLRSGAYACPRCKCRSPDLPCACHVCGLTLVSAPHLARSFHHLFPLGPFTELGGPDLAATQGCGGRAGGDWAPPESTAPLYCYSCLTSLSQDPLPKAEGPAEGPEESPAGVVVRCPDCRHIFCFDCDSYIHETLHNCPGCECEPPAGDAPPAARPGPAFAEAAGEAGGPQAGGWTEVEPVEEALAAVQVEPGEGPQPVDV